MEFGDVTLLFETRGLVGKHKDWPLVVKNEYYTTEGMIAGKMFYPHKGTPEEIKMPEELLVTPGGAYRSFITAVRSRNPEHNNCDAEVGHYSSSLCHLANISYRLGKPAPFDKRTRSIGDNKQVVETFDKIKDNCRVAGVNLDETTYQVGRELEFDPASERFVGDADANSLLTRKYREPFVVPSVKNV